MTSSAPLASPEQTAQAVNMKCSICDTSVYALNVVKRTPTEDNPLDYRLVCAGCVDIAALGSSHVKVRRSKS